MRDCPEPTGDENPEALLAEPRGRDAAARDLTPVARAGGIWFEIFEGPAKSPVIEIACRATRIGLAAATGLAFVLAVWTMLTT